MEFARTSGLWGCKRLRSSESRRPRLREVVGQRPKAARHPVGEPENGRPQPGANASFVIFRHLSSMCWSRWNIHLPSSTYLSIDFSTHPTTYLPIYPSIYLFPPVELVVPGLARDLLAVPDHVALPRSQAIPLVPKGLRLEGKAFHRELRFALGLLWGSVECLSAPLERVPGAHKRHSGRSSGGDSFCRRFAAVGLASCSVNPNRTVCAGTRPLAYRGSSCATRGEPVYSDFFFNGGWFLFL